MPTSKSVGIGVGLITGASGVAGSVAYSLGAFHPSIQVSKLIKEENKHVLLTSEATEWKTKWQEYTKGNKPWGNFEATENQIPADFKTKCDTKIKGTVYGADDPNYINITKYCARDKTISDLLGEQGVKFLDTKQEVDTWKTRFEEYKKKTNTLKLPNVNIRDSDIKERDYGKLSKGCENALQIKTNVKGYDSNIDAIKEWCKAK
ncbi:hypothetical protein A6V39_03850 [Candidatus Mycoplasma haematobovis]|uniref:Uncharacterized protein n=1 Tax=Candidatus Mycoplasma haematobovis TaxID=432608 RepID=A0A1A9QDD8_9MOLU|nr:hypothetical protein [Candidatus Mycoplasma haematobovis]OAL10021.1 hypothetical protein A6V39_03850 [Candidatus Mycoplasma haematobovis]